MYNIPTDFTPAFFKLVEESNNIVIVSHFSPDGDSISCVLSMYRIITDRYTDKKVRIMYTGERDDHFSYFQNFDKIEWVTDVAEHMTETDLLIMLDGGQYNRFSRLPEKLATVPKQICIDHHASTPSNFTLSVIIPEMPSCSELIFQLFEKEITLDKNLAETFLLGILTDTGNFIFLDAEQSDTLLIAKKLIDAGNININTLRSQYSPITQREFQVTQEFIKNTTFVEIPGWLPVQYTFATRDFVESNGYTDNEIGTGSVAYIAGYLTSLKGYSWGFMIKPKSIGYSISARSLPGSVNVRELLEKTSLGGGHDRAAGGLFKGEEFNTPQKAIDWLLDWMKNNPPTMN